MPVRQEKLKVLLGLTGSVATVLFRKMVDAIKAQGYDVDIILTEKAGNFFHRASFLRSSGAGKVYDDRDEWSFRGQLWRFARSYWVKGDPVLHINLRDEYAALVIAPCSANTLAKIANGLCDNLLTSVARAWDPCKPLIIAPAMNTQMWEHPITDKQITEFEGLLANNFVVDPQSKMLACGTPGMGAMADVTKIAELLKSKLTWHWPLSMQFSPPEKVVPVDPHPGAFAAHRNGHTHTGVDLYATEGTEVIAVEDGVVVNIEPFTGPQDKSPWWEDTDCLMVRGASGVVNYGEISPHARLQVGSRVTKGHTCIGRVKRVILKGKEHPEITGWKPSMLHIELYPWHSNKASNGFEKSVLRDPTPFLLEAE